MLHARVAAILLFTLAAIAADWPRFRGPNGAGVDASSTSYPTEFNPQKNAAWKTSVPFGRSSPIVFGDRLFLTAAENGQLITLCYAIDSGKLLWRRDVPNVHKQALFRANDPASPSAAADSSGVYVFFPDLGLIAYSLDGKERWRHPLGPFNNFYGMSSSPVLEADTLLLLCDANAKSFLLALDKNTGKQRWKADRPGMLIGWSVPVIHKPAGQPAQVIVTGSTRIDSYYLSTGERRWCLPHGSDGAMGVALLQDDSVFVYSTGHDTPMVEPFEALLAKYDTDKDGKVSRQEFQANKDFAEHFGWADDDRNGFIDAAEWKVLADYGTGDHGVVRIRPAAATGQLPASAVAWRVKGKVPYVPAPLLYRGVYFMVKDGGIVTALDPETGKILKQGRAAQSLGEYFASPVAADGKVYLLSGEGKLTVLKAAGDWDVLTVNDMQEDSFATPALAGGRIYVRTRSALYCFTLNRN